jgi:hypothetical protein
MSFENSRQVTAIRTAAEYDNVLSSVLDDVVVSDVDRKGWSKDVGRIALCGV